MTELEITHLEYHPSGNESSAQIVRAFARSHDGSVFLLDGEGEAERVPLSALERQAEYLFELPQAVSGDSSSAVVAFGPTYIGLVRAIEENRGDGGRDVWTSVIRNVAQLPDQSHGVRIFVGDAAESSLLTMRLSRDLLRVFDEECRQDRILSPFMLMLWSAISRDPRVDVVDRVVRGDYLFASRRDERRHANLWTDARIFDADKIPLILDAVREYKLDIEGAVGVREHEPVLALNAKMDLLNNKVQELQESVSRKTRQEAVNIFVSPVLRHAPIVEVRPRGDLKASLFADLSSATKWQLSVPMDRNDAFVPKTLPQASFSGFFEFLREGVVRDD